jgi:hypothetical protein
VDFSGRELAALAVRENFSEDQLQAIGKVFDYMAEKKHSTVIQTLLKLSRHLPAFPQISCVLY